MNQEFITHRLQEIEEAIEQTVAQHNALQGAKDELLNLLEHIGKAVAIGIANAAVESAAGIPGVGTMAAEIIHDVINQTQEKHD